MKKVYVTVALTIPEDIDFDQLIAEMGYQFSYYENEQEQILDTEIINAYEEEKI